VNTNHIFLHIEDTTQTNPAQNTHHPPDRQMKMQLECELEDEVPLRPRAVKRSWPKGSKGYGHGEV
jgi:hypothetical protein